MHGAMCIFALFLGSIISDTESGINARKFYSSYLIPLLSQKAHHILPLRNVCQKSIAKLTRFRLIVITIAVRRLTLRNGKGDAVRLIGGPFNGSMFYVEHHLIITIMECICGNPIEQPRADLGLSSCLSCAQVAQKYWQKPKGVMCFGHKTGGELQIVSQTQFAELSGGRTG